MSKYTKAELRAERFGMAALVHMDSLYRLALYAMGDEDGAQKVVRNTYLKAYTSFDESEIKFSFKVWLFWILDDVLTSAIPRHKAEEQRIKLSRDTHPEEGSLGIPRTNDAAVAMGELPARYGIAILLADVEGLSHEEIAYVVGCSEKTVMSRLCKGRRLFRKGLQSQKLQGLGVAAG